MSNEAHAEVSLWIVATLVVAIGVIGLVMGGVLT